MQESYEIDSLDREILQALTLDARRPYIDIASELGVAGGTVHLRIDKMKQAGILKSFTTSIDYKKLGYKVHCLIGVKLHQASNFQAAIKKLEKCQEVTASYYTTGAYNLFIEVYAADNDELYRFLLEKIQKISEIQSTETAMILNVPIERSIL